MTVSTGTVRAFTIDPENAEFGRVVVTDAQVLPGNSGSALLDADGAIIGVVYAKTDDGWSMAIPVTTLRTLMQTEGAFTELSTCE
jgi:S1-C subfamily serine protease